MTIETLGNIFSSPFAISHLTFSEVEAEINRMPVLIVPLGGCEPYGEYGALGVASVCAGAVAAALSSKLEVLLAPTFSFGCSTPFAAFGGTSGVKSRTLTNIICEASRMWYIQGFKAIVLIDALAENHDAVLQAGRRLARSNPDRTVLQFSLQQDERVRAFIGDRISGKEFGRCEYGLVSMAAFLDPGLVRLAAEEPPDRTILTEPQRFRSWRKRGSDPAQFRKLFRQCSSSTIAHRYNTEFGRELFAHILQLIEENIAPCLKTLGQGGGQ